MGIQLQRDGASEIENKCSEVSAIAEEDRKSDGEAAEDNIHHPDSWNCILTKSPLRNTTKDLYQEV